MFAIVFANRFKREDIKQDESNQYRNLAIVLTNIKIKLNNNSEETGNCFFLKYLFTKF
jgi:hypothetical protein